MRWPATRRLERRRALAGARKWTVAAMRGAARMGRAGGWGDPRRQHRSAGRQRHRRRSCALSGPARRTARAQPMKVSPATSARLGCCCRLRGARRIRPTSRGQARVDRQRAWSRRLRLIRMPSRCRSWDAHDARAAAMMSLVLRQRTAREVFARTLSRSKGDRAHSAHRLFDSADTCDQRARTATPARRRERRASAQDRTVRPLACEKNSRVALNRAMAVRLGSRAPAARSDRLILRG